ncbi:hypothetical protein JOM56_010237 [Amanita muscaria]
MSQTSNIISPCSRLNDDVLREIFIHCIIRSSYTDYYYPEKVFRVGYHHKQSICEHPQFSLSQVCSSWRDIALLTPQLWDSISIVDLTSEANVGIAREYLSRAGNVPISVLFDPIRSMNAPWKDSFHRSNLINFLSSYRLRSLWFNSNILPLHLFLPSLTQQSVADLESLLVWHRYDSTTETSLDLNESRYPKLAVVRILGGEYQISSHSSLHIFTSAGPLMTVIQSLDLLSHCPSLEESALWITRANGSQGTVSMPQIHLRHLRILTLHLQSRRDEIHFSTFMEVLSLPVLEELLLEGQAVTWSATAFQSLAHRSNYFPHLRKFCLGETTSNVDAGILLASMPWLKSISLCPYNTGTNKVIFDDLALNGLASGSLAPRLQSFYVGPISNAGSFLDMVESRMENAQMSSNGIPAPFTEVEFKYADDTQDYSESRLLDMRQL